MLVPEQRPSTGSRTHAMEVRVENLERIPHIATFVKVDLILGFTPGHDKHGAVVKRFLNAIHHHDECVHQVEEKWKRVDELQLEYNRMNKVYRNMDAFLFVANKNPVDLEQYEELVPRMRNIKERLAKITDKQIKEAVMTEYRKFKKTEKQYARLVSLREAVERLKVQRNVCQNELTSSQLELNQCRNREDELANQISQDHMAANDKGLALYEMFPNVHVGYILTHINDTYVEHDKFSDVISTIKYTKSPHICIFKRYDYTLDLATGKWVALQRRRSLNVYVEDPLIRSRDLILAIVRGDVATVAAAMRSGANPNTYDHTLTSLLHLAASHNHIDVVTLLLDSGAVIDPRDKNMATPLLLSVRKGLLSMAQLLLDRGAEKFTMDRMSRSCTYFASTCGNLALAKLFINSNNCNSADNVWSSTPLHIAAARGDGPLCRYLLEKEASVYLLDDKQQTAEDVAREAKHDLVYSLLREYRLDAPGQLAITLESNGRTSHMWIGDHSALESASWLSHTNLNYILCVLGDEEKSSSLSLATPAANNSSIKFMSISNDDDDETSASWDSLCNAILEVLSSLSTAVDQGGNIFVCDSSGFTLSATILAVFLLLKHQIRVENTENQCVIARPCVFLSLSHRKGLIDMQSKLDKMRMRRLDSRLRTSPIISMAF